MNRWLQYRFRYNHLNIQSALLVKICSNFFQRFKFQNSHSNRYFCISLAVLVLIYSAYVAINVNMRFTGHARVM